jgi:hypothetical protein
MSSVVSLIEIVASGFRRRDDVDVLMSIVFCLILLRTEDVLFLSTGQEQVVGIFSNLTVVVEEDSAVYL